MSAGALSQSVAFHQTVCTDGEGTTACSLTVPDVTSVMAMGCVQGDQAPVTHTVAVLDSGKVCHQCYGNGVVNSHEIFILLYLK